MKCLICSLSKLPPPTISQSYDLEYGSDTIEICAHDVGKDDHVLIVDDLLATGGTALAACQLIEKAGAKVAGVGKHIETSSLNV